MHVILTFNIQNRNLLLGLRVLHFKNLFSETGCFDYLVRD